MIVDLTPRSVTTDEPITFVVGEAQYLVHPAMLSILREIKSLGTDRNNLKILRIKVVRLVFPVIGLKEAKDIMEYLDK